MKASFGPSVKQRRLSREGSQTGRDEMTSSLPVIQVCLDLGDGLGAVPKMLRLLDKALTDL